MVRNFKLSCVKKVNKLFLSFIFVFLSVLSCKSQSRIIQFDTIPYPIYPLMIEDKPDLPSPFATKKGIEYVVAVTNKNKYAIIDVTLSNDGLCPQLIIDSKDFPELAESGLHSEKRLNELTLITGRSLDEITELGRPNGLSQAGFMAQDETILSVLKGDNLLVSKLGFKHPELAKPLFHVLNMMQADLSLNRWNMAKHKWENIRYFYYNDHKVFVEAEDTKGGQKSIFNDNIEGGFFIKLWYEFDNDEILYLKQHYSHLLTEEFNDFKTKLSHLNTGEMQPQYIMRYGFYEGHTFWRTDPIAISFIFGLKSLQELSKLFDFKLNDILSANYTE